jgi:hypothetical protein
VKTERRDIPEIGNHTAAWLAEDPEREIVTIIFVDGAQWVAVRANGHGHATVLDSLHEDLGSFPKWWSRDHGLG